MEENARGMFVHVCFCGQNIVAAYDTAAPAAGRSFIFPRDLRSPKRAQDKPQREARSDPTGSTKLVVPRGGLSSELDDHGEARTLDLAIGHKDQGPDHRGR